MAGRTDDELLRFGPHPAHEAVYMARCLELERRRPPRLAGGPLPALLLPGGSPARVLTQHHRDGDASLSSVSTAPSRQPYASSNPGTRRARSATARKRYSGGPCAETNGADDSPQQPATRWLRATVVEIIRVLEQAFLLLVGDQSVRGARFGERAEHAQGLCDVVPLAQQIEVR